MNKYISTSFLMIAGVMINAQIKKADTLSSSRHKEIEQIELFGEKKPKGLEVITRLPLKTRDQIQSISVISYKAIETLGGLSLIDITKNIPGVTLFSSYGGTNESMSIRGYRGVPVLKNGVLLDSDFRTAGMITDMQGVESIQVIKGSVALTQGIGDGLGSAGGVINVVTKRPQFINKTNVGFRYGSWDFYRPTVDFQKVLDSEGKVAIRFNGAYQNNNSFRSYVKGERIYINPSVSFRPDKMTDITVEMDYMDDKRTPDRGTVNLANGTTEALYKMPKGKFLGFSEDYVKTETYNFVTSIDRKINDKFKIRSAFMNSVSNIDSQAMSIAPNGKNWNERKRSYRKSMSEDVNKVFQFDFIGQDLKTGFIKHTFQVGFDWKETTVTSTAFKVYKDAKDMTNDKIINTSDNPIDIINVLGNIPNNLPYTLIFSRQGTGITKTPTIGVMAQDVMAFGKYVKTHLGIRYSRLNGSTKDDVSTWNPTFGLIVSPLENVNIFGSYTTTTSLRSANNLLQKGGKVGPSKTAQWEVGIKSDWFNEKLRFNVTAFNIKTDHLAYQILDANYNPVTDPNNNRLYGLAGNLKRKGVEIELIGKILTNLQIMSGWSYLDAQYQDSPSYVNGSAPMNAPKHTANLWLNYKLLNTRILDGLDVGAGIYYVGKRPVDEWTQKTFTAGHVNSVQPGSKPFDMPEYTTVDAQLGYDLNNISLKVFINNIFNRVGYSSYFRGGFLDQIQPRNYAIQVNYKF